MLTTETLSKAQVKIIREICFIQLQSLQRLIEGKSYVDPEVIEQIQEVDITEEEFLEDLEDKMGRFNELTNEPHRLARMKDSDLSAIRHILTNIQDRFNERYPNAIKNLWMRLFFIEELKTQNYN